jgi:hypothetical protein
MPFPYFFKDFENQSIKIQNRDKIFGLGTILKFSSRKRNFSKFRFNPLFSLRSSLGDTEVLFFLRVVSLDATKKFYLEGSQLEPICQFMPGWTLRICGQIKIMLFWVVNFAN